MKTFWVPLVEMAKVLGISRTALYVQVKRGKCRYRVLRMGLERSRGRKIIVVNLYDFPPDIIRRWAEGLLESCDEPRGGVAK